MTNGDDCRVSFQITSSSGFVSGSASKDYSLIYNGNAWESTTPSLTRASLGFGPAGGTIGNSGDILVVNQDGGTLEYVKGYVGRTGSVEGVFSVPGLSCDAGATFGGAVNLIDNELSRPKLKDYAETVNAIGTIIDDFTINITNGNVQTVTIGGDCEVDFTHWPATGIAGTLTLIITNGGAHTVTWDDDVIKWPGNNAPSLTSSGVDIVSFMTIDAGTIVYGFVGGIKFL